MRSGPCSKQGAEICVAWWRHLRWPYWPSTQSRSAGQRGRQIQEGVAYASGILRECPVVTAQLQVTPVENSRIAPTSYKPDHPSFSAVCTSCTAAAFATPCTTTFDQKNRDSGERRHSVHPSNLPHCEDQEPRKGHTREIGAQQSAASVRSSERILPSRAVEFKADSAHMPAAWA